MTCCQRQWLRSLVGRASHRYREVTGSNPVEVLNFFQASLRICINCVHCDDHFFTFICFVIVVEVAVFIAFFYGQNKLLSIKDQLSALKLFFLKGTKQAR